MRLLLWFINPFMALMTNEMSSPAPKSELDLQREGLIEDIAHTMNLSAEHWKELEYVLQRLDTQYLIPIARGFMSAHKLGAEKVLDAQDTTIRVLENANHVLESAVKEKN